MDYSLFTSVAAHRQLRKNLEMRKPSDASPNSLSECSICLYPIGVCHSWLISLTSPLARASSLCCSMFTYMAFQMHTANHHRTFPSLYVSQLSSGRRPRGSRG